MSLWKKLNQGQEFIKIEIPQEQLCESVIVGFILDEFRKAIILIHVIHKSFTGLSKIIKGFGILDENSASVATKLMSHEANRNN